MSTTLAGLKNLVGFQRNAKSAPIRRFKPRVESLEDRRLLAVLLVDPTHFTTIQAAVNASANGDKIRVADGTYAENVLVNKKLTIEAIHQGAAKVDPVDDLSPGSPAFGFNLQAKDIVIKGFTIGESIGGIDSADPDGSVGINTSAAFSGYKIRDNVIENNNFGIYLNTATGSGVKKTHVEDNTIRNNNNGFGVLASAGNGIYSDQGAQAVEIEDNTFTGHQNEDIIFVAPTALQTDLSIEDNTLTDSSGIFFMRVSDSEIEGNRITRSLYHAIELAGGNTFVEIECNRLTDVGVLGYNGIFLHDNSLVGPNTNNEIEDNVIKNAGLSGIVIRDSAFNSIEDNRVSGSIGFDLTDPTWGNGISLENADNNRVKDNKLTSNARDGIRVDAASSDNLLKANFAKSNNVGLVGGFDYHDDSAGSGSGTPPTANFYSKNKGGTQSRPGLITTFV